MKINLLKRLFRKRLKDAVPVYLKRFGTIDRMIDCGLIAIDLEKRLVMLDALIHLQYEASYPAFFDTLRAYMNYKGGLAGLDKIGYDDRIDFTVMIRHSVFADENTGEVFDSRKEEYVPLLIGYCRNGKVDYAAYKE